MAAGDTAADDPDMRFLDCPDKLDNYKRLVQYIEQ
jgi:hypothetical protein